MIWPGTWSDVPHNNRTALLDHQGGHALWHQVVADVASRAGKPYQTYPLGDGIGSPIWQALHQREHVNAALALGITGPPILTDYDFKDAAAFHTYMFVHAQESIRLAAAAGVV